MSGTPTALPRGYVFDWRKWGFGFSVEINDPAFLRLWIGPVRLGWKWGRNV